MDEPHTCEPRWWPHHLGETWTCDACGHGYLGATTRRIAEEAEVSEVTLFRLFGTKEAVLEEAIGEARWTWTLEELHRPTRGEPVTDDSFYLIFNPHFEAVDFILPPDRWGLRWLKVLDTTTGWVEDALPLEAGAKLRVAPRSLVLLQRQA